MRHSSGPGFTLIELVAALMVTGCALLGGIMLLDQLSDSAVRIARDGASAAREANGSRLLYRLLADARTGDDTTMRFTGDAHGLEFWTSCDVPSGWSVLCRVVLAIDARGDSSVVLAEQSTGGSFVLRRQNGSSEFRYFSPASIPDSAWLRQWSSNTTLPVAVGLLVGRDTVVIPVSARD